MNRPVIVMPMSDRDGLVFPHLFNVLPDLKNMFDKGIVSIPLETQQTQPVACQRLMSDHFFMALPLTSSMPVGIQFRELYQYASEVCSPDQIMHLCYPDRVSYALQSVYRQQFMDDIRQIRREMTPLLFQRSKSAWQTHPEPYYRLEQMVTHLGEILFGISLDFAWCHLVVNTRELNRVLSRVVHPDISMVAEMVMHLRDEIHTRNVDWLAWEDPFILNKDAEILKDERAKDPIEIQKRLKYILPMMQILGNAYNLQ